MADSEWYTPTRYVEAARQTMGGIDLDPASCEAANSTVKAARYYTKGDNGLALPWSGRVWLNPPYGREHASQGVLKGGGKSIIAQFVSKLLREFRNGQVEQAVLLATADTDAGWFQPLWDYPVCFVGHRVLFYRPGLPKQGQIFSTSFAYLGPNVTTFVELFSRFGRVVRAIDPPRSRPVACELWS